MTGEPFVDHYEVLQLSQTADVETVARVYRLLAKRYHPDNTVTGDAERFGEVSKAQAVLSDPERRAEYDVTYDEEKGHQWRIFDQESAADGREEDRRIAESFTAFSRCSTSRGGETQRAVASGLSISNGRWGSPLSISSFRCGI